MASFLPPLIVLPVHGVVQFGSNAGRTWLMRRHIDNPIVRLSRVCFPAVGAGHGRHDSERISRHLGRYCLAEQEPGKSIHDLVQDSHHLARSQAPVRGYDHYLS